MVCLTPRFLFLAALVATAAMPSFVLHSDARAIDLTVHHHNDKSSSAIHSTSSALSKGKGEVVSTPVIPPPPVANGNTPENKKTKKHRKGSKKDDKRDAYADTWDPLDPFLQIGNFKVGDGRNSPFSDTHHLLSGISARDSDHHRHHHHERQGEETQEAFSLNRRAASRIPSMFKRSPHNHHDHDDHDGVVVNGDNDRVHYDRRSPHHHEHHDHDKVVVNGDNDDVHIHERRTFFRAGLGLRHHESVSNNFGSDNNIGRAGNIGINNERRDPHHHHDHGDHGKLVVNGSNDNVHVHDRRTPHHHHHGEHDKTVINGNKDDVHVHGRDVNPAGVPGTVDIMSFGNTVQKLASLVVSSVSDNSTTNSSFPVNSTKATSDPDRSPFILDASNTTQTQFFLVVVNDTMPSRSPDDALVALKAAASAKSATEDPADIKVTLQMSVFDPSLATMSPYCATFDPNPSRPAPLTMEKCGAGMETFGNASDASVHKSQTFAYEPFTGTVQPVWSIDSNSPAGSNSSEASSNLTDTSSDSNSTSNSTSGLGDKQMNFKIPNSNKDAPVPDANVTQTVNGTAPSVPARAPISSGPQNVVLVFTPAGPTVHAVNDASDVASFEPADSSDPGSDSGEDGSDSSNDSDDVSSSMSVSSDSSIAMSTDSSGATTSTDSGSAVTPTESESDVPSVQATTTSDATDVTSASATLSTEGSESDSESMMPTSTTSDDTTVPTPTSTVDEAAIEKMYEQETDIV